MKQKTLRFYEESKSDMEAYKKLEDFRQYGFNSARELIIAAINTFSQRRISYEPPLIDADELAECIAKKLCAKGFAMESQMSINNGNQTENKDEIFEKALNFIEGL